MNIRAHPLSTAGDIRIASLQGMVQGGHWDVEASRSLSSDLVLWITKGQGRSMIDGHTRGYGPHTAIFVPAGTLHGVEIGPRVQGYALFVPGGLGAGLPDGVAQIRAGDVFEQGEMTRHVEAVQAELGTRGAGHDRAVAAHVALIAVWFERRMDRNERAGPPKSSAAQRLVRDFTRLIGEEVDAGKSVSDFAAALSVTPTHLSRVCRDSFGKPASEVLQDRLILEARRLLGDPELKVRDVSDRLGFSSPAYFTRLFTQRTGASPTAFRSRGARRG